MSGHTKWLRWAQCHFKYAKYATLVTNDSETFGTAAYLCHQSTEKALKAFLALLSQPIPQAVDLEFILESCIELDPQFQALQHACKTLNPYFNASYPNDRPPIDQAEITAALEKTAKVLALTKKIIDEHERPGTRLF